tara:strand:+ start:8330 stop:8785 length:456 start_codon:yes stop_codon:yes gene_type:complete
MNIEVQKEYGYVLLVGLALYLTQQLILLIPVLKMRSQTKIKAPTLYPRDSEIKELELKTEDVEKYMRAQRAHQNNVELMSVFMPMFLIIGLFKPKKAAIGGLVVLVFRILGGVGYFFKKRVYGAPFHLGEIYILYLGFLIVYELLKKKIEV